MDRRKILEKIEESGVFAVIRLNDGKQLYEIVSALSAGGVTALEITMTTPSALDLMKEFTKTVSSDFIIGAGSVLETAETNLVAPLSRRKLV
ncbi:MAG: hypothetical protein WC703_07905 [Candidatus Neomarinimicrobiota bacterium]